MITEVRTQPKLKPLLEKKREPYDLIILGGGPAGMAAALYALRERLRVLIIEKMIMGGVASTAYFIENYPGFPEGITGMDLCERMSEQIRKLGLEIIWGNALGIKNKKNIKEVIIDGKTLQAKTVIISTGSEIAKLNVPGEKEFWGKGVSYCATCDGPFYKDKNLMVVGGGNTAIEEALFLTRYANKISIAHRRDELRADKVLAERAMTNPKIYFFWNTIVESITGKDKVQEIVLKDLKHKNKLKIPVDGIFIYVGFSPNSDIVKDIVKLDKESYILTDQSMKTSVDGIFAAGDIRSKPLRQIVTAVSDGAIAAESARKYIEDNASS